MQVLIELHFILLEITFYFNYRLHDISMLSVILLQIVSAFHNDCHLQFSHSSVKI